MHSRALASALGVSLVVASAAAGSVLELNSTAFFDLVNAKGKTTVAFFGSRNCGNCVRAKPEFQSAAAAAEADGMDLTWVYIDANEEQDASEAVGISDVPTYFLFRGDDISNKETLPRMRTGPAMLAAVKQVLGQPLPWLARELRNSSEALEHLFWRGTDGGVVLSSLLLSVPSGLAEEFAAAKASGVSDADLSTSSNGVVSAVAGARLAFASAGADLLEDMILYESSDDELRSLLGLPADTPGVVLIKNYDEGKVVYEGSLTASPADGAALVAWARKSNIPRVTEVDHVSLARTLRHDSVPVHVFIQEKAVEDPRVMKDVRNELTRALEEMEAAGELARGDVMLLITNGDQYNSWMTRFGLAPRVVPALGLDQRGEGNGIGITLDGARKFTTALEDQQAEAEVGPDGEAKPKKGGRRTFQGDDGIVYRRDIEDDARVTLPLSQIREWLKNNVRSQTNCGGNDSGSTCSVGSL